MQRLKPMQEKSKLPKLMPMQAREDEDEDEDEDDDEDEEKVVSIISPLDFLKDIEKTIEKGIKHCTHKHRLYFQRDVRYTKTGYVDCKSCGLLMKGYGFTCPRKFCNFRLHQFCALVPKMIQYPNHSQHPLSLRIYTEKSAVRLNCNVCETEVRRFGYYCPTCIIFHVDLKCASVNFLVYGRHHRHPLTPRLYHASFVCSLCGNKHDEFGLSYDCRTCIFWIHDECYSLPHTLQHASHVHPLRIGYYKSKHILITHKCSICEKAIKWLFMAYSCDRCDYYIHLNCSHKKWDKKVIEISEEEHSKLIQFPMLCTEPVQNILAYFIKEKWKDIDDINDDLLYHPSHDHPLSLIDESNENGTCLELYLPNWYNLNMGNELIVQQSCNACTLPLLDASFYSCSQSCNFVLHKWCAKLPREIQHPTTLDTMILHERYNFGIFQCTGCKQIGNGFAYKYLFGETSLYLDLRCASLPSFVKHETHEHHLHLKDGQHTVCCSSCGKRIVKRFSYGCDACNYSIGICCLFLPKEITNWYDRHAYKLTYSVSTQSVDETDEQEYYCEFCEMKLDPIKWIYHCFEWNRSVDTLCARRVFNIFQDSIKFGGSYDDSSTQQHPLTCIPISRKYDLSFIHKQHPLICIPVSRKFYNFCSICRDDVVKCGSHVFSCTHHRMIVCIRCVSYGLMRSEPDPEPESETD